MSTYYGTVAVVSGTRAKAEVGTGGLSGVLLGNESGLTIKVTLDGTGSSKSLYPGYVDWFPIPSHGFNGNILFDPVANLSNISSWPSSYVQIDLFGPMEAPSGTYPVALPRLNNVGNTVSTNMGSSTSVQNDNNVASTQFIEATQSGSPSSNVFFDNSGNVTIREYQGGVNNILFQLIAGASTDVKLSFLNKFCEVLGGLIVDQTLQVTGNTTLSGTLGVTGASTLTGGATVGSAGVLASSGVDLALNANSGQKVDLRINGGNELTVAASDVRVPNGKFGKAAAGDLIDASGASDVYYKALGGNINFQSPSGTSLGSFQSGTNGMLVAQGKIGQTTSGDIIDASGTDLYLKGGGSGAVLRFQAPNGTTVWSISHIATQSAALTSGTHAYTHNLGWTPDIIIGVATTASSSATFGYDTPTSTTVNLTVGASLTFKLLFLKF